MLACIQTRAAHHFHMASDLMAFSVLRRGHASMARYKLTPRVIELHLSASLRSTGAHIGVANSAKPRMCTFHNQINVELIADLSGQAKAGGLYWTGRGWHGNGQSIVGDGRKASGGGHMHMYHKQRRGQSGGSMTI
jgi:hypothetical protein